MKKKKLTALVLSLALAVTGTMTGFSANNAKAADYGLSNPRVDSEGNVTWDCAYFGSYNTSFKEWKKDPIKWRVLSVDENNNAFIVADMNLDCKKYNETNKSITWEKSTIRSWLNGYDSDSNLDGIDYSVDNFIDTAFTEEEQAVINTTTVINNDNSSYRTEGGNDTQDKIYLLSLEEVSNAQYGFDAANDVSSKSRVAKSTKYAQFNGADTIIGLGDIFGSKNSYWWLRSPGGNSNNACYLSSMGYSSNYGGYVINDNYGVRPALRINLSSSVWSDAGITDSEGNNGITDGDIDNPVIENGVTTWDCIYFGSYNQSSRWNKEPIKWRVLSVDGNDAFFMADSILDCKPYNETSRNVTWEVSTIRSWLNGYDAELNNSRIDYSTDSFINEAFTEEEQAAINTTTVINNDNPLYEDEYGGKNTQDKIYLLSVEEVRNMMYGFERAFSDSSKTREAKCTDYAKFNGAYTDSSSEYAGNGYWYLRSPKSGGSASFLNCEGYGNSSYRIGSGYGVRPVLHINLSSSVWEEAGTVTSKWNKAGFGDESTVVPSTNPNPQKTESPDIGQEGTTNKYGLSNPRVDNEGNVTWDCAYFGSYNQTAEWTKEPIKWRVLSVDEDNNAFIVADKNLDCKPYNETTTEVTWEKSTLRSWLNGYGADSNIVGIDYSTDNFIDAAFTDEEKSTINTTNVANNDNPKYEIDGGSNTEDKIYLLSIEEVSNADYGFGSTYDEKSKTRYVKNTEYAKFGGVTTASADWEGQEYDGNGYWWLRSPGDISHYASYVSYYGSGNYFGSNVKSGSCGVRPALHINLSSSVWSDAGVTDSEGNDGVSNDGINNPVVENGVTTWDCIYFGNYNQTFKEWKREPIKWRVLSVDGDDAFFIADKCLDYGRYNEAYKRVTWETTTIRSWLNGYGADSNIENIDYSNDNFIDNAFNEEEQEAINTTTVINNDNPLYETDGGNNTEDKIYLLSIEEVCNPAYGFDHIFKDYSKTREAKNTDYVQFYSKGKDWWLRSPGDYVYGLRAASYVDYRGWGSYLGWDVNYGYNKIRPALHINLSSSVWENAGTVTSVMTNYGEQDTPSQTPTSKPTVSPSVSPVPQVTDKPSDGTEPTENPIVTEAPTITAEPEGEATPTTVPDSTYQPIEQPTQAPVVTQTPAPIMTQAPVQTVAPTEVPKADEEDSKTDKVKTFNLSSLKIKKNATKITGKVSVSKATVKIKVGSKAWKKATVKGKKFTLKTAKLKKNTKVQIKVSKKGYKTLKKSYKVK